ncbi:MAG: toll/interleukin-1 receptor domain-containing protein, partial [Armatimonadota bacterium]|nr:toll/interleukin-1 receptor domain-containing protein [Armatimonadota bacterium]
MDTPPTTNEAINYKYWAFISYSHQDEDWAKWLHQSLETYHIPRSIVGRETAMGNLPRRLFPIFRDRDELPGAAELNDQIEAALRRSRSLIVICSPKSARSKWVNEEIRIFKGLGRTQSVFCLIIDGEPNATDNPDSGLLECFPEAVRHRVDAQGTITGDRMEPIAADARPGRDGRSNAMLKLLAGLLGVGYDELKQRERRRLRWRRMRLAGSVAVMLLFVLMLYTGLGDVGLSLPGAETTRRLLDRYNASVFRPVQSVATAHRDAALQRMVVFEQFPKAKMGNWLTRVFNPKPDEDLEVWSHSQTLTAIMATPDATNEQLRPYLPCLDAPFTPDQEIEVNGVRYGWLGHPYWCYTQSGPALWTAAALATALARPGLLTGAVRDRCIQHLNYTQDVLKLYHPKGGGWATFLPPAKPKYPYEPDAYATVLALMAL